MQDNSWVIGDRELENLLEAGQDKLDTKRYVNQLFSIIKNLSVKELKGGFNIGLYGGWGSGKTSIVKALENEIKKNCDDEYCVIYFDCWKYSNDDLRRSILLEISKKYDFKVQGELKNIIYHDRQEINKNVGLNFDFIKNFFKWIKNNRNWRHFLVKFVLILILSLVLLYFYKKFHVLFNVIISGGVIASFSALVELFGKLSDYIKELVPSMEITHNIVKGRTFSGEQFEEIFMILVQKGEGVGSTEYLTKLVKENESTFYLKSKKILFIFDNIDRCESDVVKEILMTIKTFLNQDNCIFLLPIDYDNVCKSYENYEQGDEYLRKIFNLGINLKRPHYGKLSDLIIDLMETNLRKDKKGLNITDEEANFISYMLASAFADNPRKIKQFLNQLGAEYVLYNKEKSILSILKELIIRVELPKLYNYLTEDQNIVNANEELNNLLHNKDLLDDKYKDLLDDKHKNREKILLNKIGCIPAKLELLDNENIKLEKVYYSSKDFLSLIKKDKLKEQANKLLYSYIESARIGGYFEQISLLENSIYYMSEYGIDKILFDNIFKESNEFCNKDVLNIIQKIDAKILYKFLKAIGETYVNKLPKLFKSIFTDRIIINFNNEVSEFKKLNENIQDLLIDNEVVFKYYNEESEKESFKESNCFKLLQEFPKYVTDKFIKSILKDVDYDSFDFSNIKSNNMIRVISVGNKFTEEILQNIFKLGERFVNSYQNYINDYLGNGKNVVDSYLICSKIVIKYGKGDSLHNKTIENLVNLYNSYNIKEFKEEVYKIFLIDFKRFSPYNRPYADIIINGNDDENIEKMIEKTNNQGDRLCGLTEIQVLNIINRINWNDDSWDGVIKAVRKNKIMKNMFFQKIIEITEDNEKIAKIKKLDSLNILSEEDKEYFGLQFVEKIKNWLLSENMENMKRACDFIEQYHNSNIMKYTNYNDIYNLLKIFDINKFKSQFNADVFDVYKNSRMKALRFLTNLKKKFNNLDSKNK